jgi:hypothetical protein
MRHRLPFIICATAVLAVAGTLGFQHATSAADDDGPPLVRDPKHPVAWVDGSEGGMRLGLIAVRRSGPKVVTVKLRLAAARNVSTDILTDEHDLELGDEGWTDDVAGMRLLDEVHGNELSPIHDGDECICSPVTSMPPGTSIDVYAKFPAPPRGVERVAVHLPGFPSFDGVRISG